MNSATKTHSGLQGVFDAIVYSADIFSTRKGIIFTYDDDFTVIPVNIKKDGETVRVIENGILIECYHEQVDHTGGCRDCRERIV